LKLIEFFNYNSICPICNNPLTLYLQWVDSFSFKCKQKDNVLKFNLYLDFDPNKNTTNDYLLLDKNNLHLTFSSNSMLHEAERFFSYFFYLCNPFSVNKVSYGTNQINVYKACYYRVSPVLEIINDTFKVVNPDHQNLVNKEESFSLSKFDNDKEKIFIVSSNFENNKLTFWHYILNQKNKSSLLKKEIPLPPFNLDLSLHNRNNLIKRLEGWVTLA